MSLLLVTNAVASNLGDYLNFQDITGTTSQTAYSKNGNIGYADVDGVRLKIATLSSIEDTATITTGDSITRYVEYLCTAGSGTIDNKGVSSGNRYVFNTTGLTVPSTVTLETTGNYVYPVLATWLPTAAQVALSLSLSEVNQASSTTLEDSLYTIEYEVYVDSFTGTQAAVDTQQYMVLSSTATYNGNTYRAGDIFIAVGTTNIVAAGNVVKLSASTTSYHVITYNLLQEIFLALPIVPPAIQEEIYGIRVQLEMLQNSANTNNVSYTYAQGLLAKLQNQMTQILANY
jgi:hypothetical protein